MTQVQGDFAGSPTADKLLDRAHTVGRSISARVVDAVRHRICDEILDADLKLEQLTGMFGRE
jgi:hypothetical protein